MNHEVNYKGGRVFVKRAIAGWDVTHEPAEGGCYVVHWHAHKKNAVEVARARAEAYSAELYVHEPTPAVPAQNGKPKYNYG